MKYLSGTNIHLRALEPEDLDILYHSENDSSLWQYGSTLVPYSVNIYKTDKMIYIKPANSDS